MRMDDWATLPPTPERRIGFLFLPCWRTDRVRRTQAGCDGPGEPRPLLVWTRNGSRREVLAACPLAAGLGVRPGMTLAQAGAMAPGLVLRQAAPEADAAALSALAAWCRRYTPLTRAEPPDGVWLDLSGCAHLFGGEGALLSDLAERLHRAGLHSRIAVAETPGAACAVARFAPAAQGNRIAVANGALQRALSGLPVAALRLAEEQREALHAVGLRRIGLLERAPRAPLARRFGADLLLRLDQAFGRVAEAVCPEQPPAPLRERLAFFEPLLTVDGLRAANALLSGRLCARMRALELGARLLELVLIRLDGTVRVHPVRLALPTSDPRHLGRLLDERLPEVDPGEGIEVIWLLARVAEPSRPVQGNGLAGDATEGGGGLEALAPLIDTLQQRLGPNRLWRPAAVESDVPERSVARGAPLHPVRTARGATVGAAAAGWPSFLPRPVRLLDPPQPVRALAALPDHAPAWFVWRRCRHVVRRADGPERIAGEWWKRPGELCALRDYFRVEDEAGRRFWLFRRGDGESPHTGDLGWFLHGLF